MTTPSTELSLPLADELAAVEDRLVRSKLEVQEMAANDLIGALADIREKLAGSSNIDEHIKGARLLVELHGGWSKKERTDPNDNLPMFNIVINGGGVQVSHVAQDTPLAEIVDAADAGWMANTITRFAQHADVNQDIQDA